MSFEQPQEDAPPPGRRILVIDDEASIGLSCKRILGRHGHEVQSYDDPRAGLQAALGGDFDVLLVDRADDGTPPHPELALLLANWDGPVLYNDAIATGVSLQQGNPDFGQALADRIHSLAETLQDK